jgi:hypothetical protein
MSWVSGDDEPLPSHSSGSRRTFGQPEATTSDGDEKRLSTGQALWLKEQETKFPFRRCKIWRATIWVPRSHQDVQLTTARAPRPPMRGRAVVAPPRSRRFVAMSG